MVDCDSTSLTLFLLDETRKWLSTNASIVVGIVRDTLGRPSLIQVSTCSPIMTISEKEVEVLLTMLWR